MTPAKQKTHKVIWLVFAAAYVIWMVFFMDDIVLVDYATEAKRTIDGIFHNDITGMIGREWAFPIWTLVSYVTMALFTVYLNKFLFKPEGKGDKIFCILTLILGCTFATWYGFFKDPRLFTASMIGLDYPWHFRMWGIFCSASVFCNQMYMFRKYKYTSSAAVTISTIGCAAIFMTINLPSAGEELVLTSLRCVAHWVGALTFAVGALIPVMMCLMSLAKKTKDKKLIAILVVYDAMIILMVALLVFVGKDGLIENIPLWAVYAVMSLMNFTNIFLPKEEETSSQAKPDKVLSAK